MVGLWIYIWIFVWIYGVIVWCWLKLLEISRILLRPRTTSLMEVWWMKLMKCSGLNPHESTNLPQVAGQKAGWRGTKLFQLWQISTSGNSQLASGALTFCGFTSRFMISRWPCRPGTVLGWQYAHFIYHWTSTCGTCTGPSFQLLESSIKVWTYPFHMRVNMATSHTAIGLSHWYRM